MPDPRSSRPLHRLIQRFRADCQTVNAPCWICREPIDYTIPSHPYHPDAFEPDHLYPVADHPHLALDPGNLRPSHAHCNRSRGNRNELGTLGGTTRTW